MAYFWDKKNLLSSKMCHLGCCIDEQCWDRIERYFVGRNGELAKGLQR